MLIWAQIGVVAAVALLYASRVVRLRPGGLQPPPWRIACFTAGIVAIVASVAVLDGPARQTLYAHTTEVLLIADLAPILIALGTNEAVWQPLSRLPLARPLRWLGHPLAALLIWMLDFAFWHYARVFEGALRRDWLELIEHLALAGAALNMWRSLLSVGGPGRRLSATARISHLLAGRLFGGLLGAAAIWVPVLYYPIYAQSDASRSLSPMADQGIAGMIILGEMAASAIVLLLALSRGAQRAPRRSPPLGSVRESSQPPRTRRSSAI